MRHDNRSIALYQWPDRPAADGAAEVQAWGRSMIFDHRTYTCRPGTIQKQLALYQEHGLETQRKHLGEPILYGFVETGDVNSYVHVWVYEDAADRARKRAAMAADPAWQAYLEASAEAGYLIRQENKILQAVPFIEHRR